MQINKSYVYLVALYFALMCSPLFAWIFGPSSYEECAVEAAKDARTKDALRVLIAQCDTEFPARKNSLGEYVYYDNVTRQNIIVSSSKLSQADKEKIKRLREEFLARERNEEIRIAQESAKALPFVEIKSWKIECKGDYSIICPNKVITAIVKNNYSQTIGTIYAGYIVGKNLKECRNLRQRNSTSVRIPPKGTATVIFETSDGPSSGGYSACFQITGVKIL